MESRGGRSPGPLRDGLAGQLSRPSSGSARPCRPHTSAMADTPRLVLSRFTLQPCSLTRGTVEVVVDVEDAAALAEEKLAQVLPRRWWHVRSVARRARWVAEALGLPDDLVAAAWLHDIGYSPDLVETGFHPLDGARYLRRSGVDGQVVSLVAYHSCAQIEAGVRGLGGELAAEFSPADQQLTDALLDCDMTTGPDGDHVRPADRLVEIRGRYGSDDEVTRFVELAAPEILAAAGRVETMLAAQPRQGPGCLSK
jgi:HD domain